MHLLDYLSRVGDDADVRCALASCLYAAGRNDGSRDVVHAVLRAAPAHPLAQTLMRTLGDVDGAGRLPGEPDGATRVGEAMP